MSDDGKTEIQPPQKKKKLIYTLKLLFFGTLFFLIYLFSSHHFLFFALLNAQALPTVAMLWLSLALPPAGPFFVSLLLPKSLAFSLLVALIATAMCIPILLWWLKVVNDGQRDVIDLFYLVFLWLLLGFGFTAFSVIYLLVASGGV